MTTDERKRPAVIDVASSLIRAAIGRFSPSPVPANESARIEAALEKLQEDSYVGGYYDGVGDTRNGRIRFALVDIIGTKNTPNGAIRRLYRIVKLDTVKPYKYEAQHNTSGHKANAETVWLEGDGSGIIPVPKGYTKVNGRLLFVSPSDYRAMLKKAAPWSWRDYDKGGSD